jgi:serine protease Do
MRVRHVRLLTLTSDGNAPGVKCGSALALSWAMLFDMMRAGSIGAGLAGWVVVAVVARSAAAEPPRDLPALTGPVAPAAVQPSAAAALTPGRLFERVRRSVVAIEHAGVPTAIGTVLAGDGRVLTALSGLAGADGADLRYADGTTVHASVENSDKAADLALLAPQAPHRATASDGLSASEADPVGTALRTILPSGGASLGPAGAGVKGWVDAHARDGEPLLRMLELDLRGRPVAGAPLLDSAGSVVGVLVRACRGPAPQDLPPAAACVPVVLGAPVSTIRSFLSKTPATPDTPAAWLGIRGEPETSGGVHGVRVVAVAPSSPAETAGLQPGVDMIASVDGAPIDTPERLAALIGKHAPGDTVRLAVLGAGKLREISVALRSH